MACRSPIKLYYFRANGLINFGDDLSPKIVEMVTGRPVEWAHPTRCDLAALGSILQRLVKHRRKRLFTAFGRKITVWGSGFIQPHTAIRASDFEFLAVRGPSTAALIEKLDQPIFGDPGILLAELAAKPVAKEYEWGIIPHYHDLADPMIRALVEAIPNATVISVRDDPIETLYKIKSCEKVVSLPFTV
ncbi:MAG: hypothetical protein U5K75_09855 [Ahrensia sp.]|nr:hypothetical protein [Ahrensia sp.]